jgi:hypothetical protein
MKKLLFLTNLFRTINNLNVWRFRTFYMALAIAACSILTVQAQKLKVDAEIVDRQTSDTNYSYEVPGRLYVQSNSRADCYGSSNSVNCSGSSTTTGTATSSRTISYDVRGATFVLRLPDNRLVVVNCESKYQLKFDYINQRSCRIPIVDNIRVEFDGDKAKLFWPVSIDGKKFQSETYKIIGILQNQ